MGRKSSTQFKLFKDPINGDILQEIDEVCVDYHKCEYEFRYYVVASNIGHGGRYKYYDRWDRNRLELLLDNDPAYILFGVSNGK